MRLLIILLIALLFPPIFGFSLGISNQRPKNRKIWALLIAGSNKWHNYRHQADVCHAYKVLLSHGIPMNNIITMMYNDIAYNPKNPYPGQIFNSPTGSNVYGNVIIDYEGKDVTPQNIIAILVGNYRAVQGGNGWVLGSTADDNVFIYFSGTGYRGFLDILEKRLYAEEINNALKIMYETKKFHELLFYIDASHSASIFENLLPNNTGVYAVTSAASTERATAAHCFSEIIEDNCLSSEFSRRWISDTERYLSWYKILGRQIEDVKAQVTGSTVSDFGDKDLRERFIFEFMGRSPPESTSKSTGV